MDNDRIKKHLNYLSTKEKSYNSSEYKDYYNKIFKEAGFGGINEEKVKAILNFATGDNVLDIACGKGQYLPCFYSLNKTVYGIDFVKEFLPDNPNIFVCGNVMQLPFKDDYFDTSVLFDILEHVDDEKTLIEAARVTKQRIIASIPLGCDNWLRDFYLTYAHYIDKTHIRYYTKDTIAGLFNKCGLKIIEELPHLTVNFNQFTVSSMEPKGGIINKMVFRLLPYVKFKTINTSIIIIADKK